MSDDPDTDRICDFCGDTVAEMDECEPDEDGFCINCGKQLEDAA